MQASVDLYRVYQLSCNIKNPYISASGEDNYILKKITKSFEKTIFAHAKKIVQSKKKFTHSKPKMRLFIIMQFWLSLLIDTFSLKSLSFLNGLSKRPEIGPRTKILNSSFGPQ